MIKKNNTITLKSIKEHIEISQKVVESMIDDVTAAASVCALAIKNGKKILLFGNGGSAADAQHIAAELSGRFLRERRGLPGLALTTDTSVLTAVGNDYGFDMIFERQVEALANEGDILIGISTSGNSPNVVKAIEKGNELGCISIGFLGKEGGKLKNICDYPLIVASSTTARIQEMHIMIGHIICEYIDQESF
jgi:D-sedoheptulose 7-phosphate isomerase